jgi:hypothetical protein
VPISRTITRQWNGDPGLLFNQELAGDTEVVIDTDVPAATTDQLVPCLIGTLANVRHIFMVASQDVSVECDAATGAEQTVTLKANIPWAWSKDTGITLPLANPMTVGMYVTNATAAAARFQFRCLLDN